MSAELLSPSDLQGEADAYVYLEQLRWGQDGPQQCPHCGSDRGAWFLRSKDPEGRKSKGGTSARSHRRVWKCRESQCRRQFSVLTNTVMHGTKMPVQVWVEVINALCVEESGLSARDVSARWGVAEKSADLMLERIQQALERPEVAGASLASNAPLWVRVQTPRIETAAQRAAASQAKKKRRADEHAAAQVKADVARALAEALQEPASEKPEEQPVEEPSAPTPASAEPKQYGWKEDPRPTAPKAAKPAKPANAPKAPKPAKAANAPKAPKPAKPANAPTAAKAAKPAAAPKPKLEHKPKPEPKPESVDAPRIDQKQVESDVQRVLAELSESEGLFAEGWLDDVASSTTPAGGSAEDTEQSLGPAWFDADDSSTKTEGQLDLFTGEEE